MHRLVRALNVWVSFVGSLGLWIKVYFCVEGSVGDSGQVEVDHGAAYVCVSEEGLYFFDAEAAVEAVGGKAVSEDVGTIFS